ncbi:hypothetical protein Lal_00022043 [Lupinus albus]|uniref:Putative mei2-like protein n=1 Tax=Lupinus albus TaxID=3870 RepID=A0A6A4ND66_LUPAL|nr:putative mei2-like protein [Lupinus albus]KAF1864385.1 hypothetical protein Lal_00022043 [Lupinus albus]
MEETGYIIRSPGNLNPTAEEFIPTNPIHFPPATVFTVPVAVGVFYGTPHLSYSTLQQPPPPMNLSTSSTRSLLISPFPSNLFISESLLRRELEVFGDVRGVQMENLLINGTVTVHFYDLRHAETALTEIQSQHMMQQARLRNYYYYGNGSLNTASPPVPPPARGIVGGRAVWAQFVVAACNDVIDGQNQGTIVVLNLDCGVSMKNVRQIFEPFGPIKELREAPTKKNQRFVEFFDIRDAAKALKEMNGKEIYGKVVVIEFSRIGSFSRKFFHSNKPLNFHNNVPPHPSPSHFSPLPPPQPHRKFSTPFVTNATNANPHSHLPQLQLPFNKPSNVYKRSSKKIANNSAGSIEDAIGSMNSSEEIGNVVEKQQDQYSNGSSRRNESVIDSTKQQQEVDRNNRHWKGKQRKNQDTRFLIKEDAIVESDSRDTRTTVMIKNIPNKYSQKLLINMLDNHCIQCNEQIGDDNDQPYSSYDFLYLPIDFNNKCNVGYGFVNMTSPEATLRLYKAFNHQHWEVFNSRKICQITYARVQGLEALKEHFKNSKFPCEVDHYMPVLFSPPRDGKKQLTEPLPLVGNNNNNNHHFYNSIPIQGE